MSDIPHARQILEQLLIDMENGQFDRMHVRASVQAALKHMVRKRHKGKNASRTATPVSVKIRDAVLQCVTENPSISTRELSEKYNVNHGRISEIIAGQYGEYGTESTHGTSTQGG